MPTNTTSEVQTTQREPERERRIFTFKATQLVWLFLGLLEALLALRFILKLIAANPDSPDCRFHLWSHRLVPAAICRIDRHATTGRHGAGTRYHGRHGGLCIDFLGN